jgi:glutamyl-tRNA synthetase
VKGPRVRFAPSPTGYFHVGSARSALFNFFVARKARDGVFILRIEDTDADRNREEWVDGIVSAMQWLGLSPDEGPFRQSDNGPAHREAISQLWGAGFLYYCDCTSDLVTARKGDNKTPGYDRFCRERGLVAGPTTALRFATPTDGTTTVHDLIRGDVVFNHSVIDDFVVAKSSGAVLYALANVVDDRADRITHVIRGEEHLPNTPKQILLWTALDVVSGTRVDLPAYAHLPLLVNEQRKKLSKRKDPVSTESYRDQGFLSEAFVNYLGLLGWAPSGDIEKAPLADFIAEFRLEDVSHSPAFFDVKKLTHLNGEYIRALAPDEFIERLTPWVRPWASDWSPTDRDVPWSPEQFDEALFFRVAPLIQERIAVLGEVPAMVDFFFLSEVPYDEAAFAKTVSGNPVAIEMLRAAITAFDTAEWTSENLHRVTADVGESLGLVLRKAQAPLRCAVTGTTVGPPLFESLEILGRSVTLERLEAALRKALG